MKNIEVSLLNNINDNFDNCMELLNFTNTAFLLLDKNKNILSTNNMLCNIIGCADSSTIISKSIYNIVDLEDHKKIEDSWSKMLNGVCVDGLEIKLKKHDNNIAWVNVSGNSIMVTQNKILWILKDISDKKMDDHKKYIEKEKKKDMVKSSIKDLRKCLRNNI